MTPLEYVNKDLHTAQGLRKVRDLKKPDLQQVSREARILARKRLFRPAMAGTEGVHHLLEDHLRHSAEAIWASIRQGMQFAKRYPLQTAVGAVLGGALLGYLLRRR
jgi:hypothetical protein